MATGVWGAFQMAQTLYDFTAVRIDGREESLASYRGMVLLIVNTASKCGFTPQYDGLQAFHEPYGPQGLRSTKNSKSCTAG